MALMFKPIQITQDGTLINAQVEYWDGAKLVGTRGFTWDGTAMTKEMAIADIKKVALEFQPASELLDSLQTFLNKSYPC